MSRAKRSASKASSTLHSKNVCYPKHVQLSCSPLFVSEILPLQRPLGQIVSPCPCEGVPQLSTFNHQQEKFQSLSPLSVAVVKKNPILNSRSVVPPERMSAIKAKSVMFWALSKSLTHNAGSALVDLPVRYDKRKTGLENRQRSKGRFVANDSTT